MIYPIEKVLPLPFPGEGNDTITEKVPDLGPLHLHICEGIGFTSEHQMAIVKPELVEPPLDIKAYYRLKNYPDIDKKKMFGHFFTSDKNIEKVWKKPFLHINMFRGFGGIISTDFSILDNMLEIQRFWNDFRNKLLTAFYQKYGIHVIAAPSWCSDLDNIGRYMEGWPHNCLIAINSTGVCHDKRSKHTWLDGYNAMLSILNPTHILRYGGMIEGERTDISTYYSNDNKIQSHGSKRIV